MAWASNSQVLFFISLVGPAESRTAFSLNLTFHCFRYLDLVEGLKRKRVEAVQRLGSVDREIKESAMNEFSILMKAVCSDGRIHPSERQMVREFMAENDISPSDLVAQLKVGVECFAWACLSLDTLSLSSSVPPIDVCSFFYRISLLFFC